ncbi:LacI family DNA-binding transcriptional regulator [Jatrophihabitans sp. YIM 134969]
MTASIEDVAKLAGVSIATVSRSLRGLPDVADATRDRVLAAAAELDYVASPFAARLASGRTSTVGVVVPFVDRWYFAQMLGSIEKVLDEADLDMLMYGLGDEGRRSSFFTRLPVRKRVDCLIVVSTVMSDAERKALEGLGMPIASVGVTNHGVLSAAIDDHATAFTATNHLLSLGRRTIARIGGDVEDAQGFQPHIERRRGYRDALVDAGLEPEAALDRIGMYTPHGAQLAMTEVLEARPDVDAVFAESDEMAYGAVVALRRAGRRIPEDVAIIGVDDHSSARYFDLSTMRQPIEQMATDVTRAVLGLTAGRQSTESAPTSRVYDTELVVRGSTDAGRSLYAEPAP